MMKKILLLLIIIVAGCKSAEKPTMDLEDKDYIPFLDFAGQLDGEKLAFIKENYNWPDGDILVINFKNPREECHFDNYVVNSETKRWWSDFYSKIKIENYSKIYVFSEGDRVKRHLDNKIYFDDKDNFLYNNYFRRKKSCFGVMALNHEGEYLQFNGHYSERQVARFIEALR